MQERNDATTDAALLFLRVSAGLMMFFGHGLGKVLNFSDIAPNFADPLGMGPEISLAMAAAAETLGSLAIIVGLKTRWASIVLLFTMLVAASTNWADGFMAMERPLVYALIFTALAISGSGKYSLDAKIEKRR